MLNFYKKSQFFMLIKILFSYSSSEKLLLSLFFKNWLSRINYELRSVLIMLLYYEKFFQLSNIYPTFNHLDTISDITKQAIQ